MPSMPGAARLGIGLCLAVAILAEGVPGRVEFSEACRARCSRFDLASLADELQAVQAAAVGGVVNQGSSNPHTGNLFQNIGHAIQNIGNSFQDLGPQMERLMIDTAGFVCEHQAAFECVHQHHDVCLPDSGSANQAGVNPSHVLDLASNGINCMCNACPCLVPGVAKFQGSLIQGVAIPFIGRLGQGAAQTALTEGICSLYEGLKCIRTSAACAGLDPFEGHEGMSVNGTSTSALAEDPEQLKAMCDAQEISTDIASDMKPGANYMADAIRMRAWPCLAVWGVVLSALL